MVPHGLGVTYGMLSSSSGSKDPLRPWFFDTCTVHCNVLMPCVLVPGFAVPNHRAPGTLSRLSPNPSGTLGPESRLLRCRAARDHEQGATGCGKPVGPKLSPRDSSSGHLWLAIFFFIKPLSLVGTGVREWLHRSYHHRQHSKSQVLL